MAEDERIYLGSKDQVTEIGDADSFIIVTSDGIRKMTKAQVMEKLGINQLTKELSSGTGSGTSWTSTQITLLETLGEYLVFKDTSTGQAMFNNLIASLRNGSSGSNEPETPVEPDIPSGSYTITNSLVNVTTDNTAGSVVANSSYTATLTPGNNYYIDSVTVTMGGVNITDTVYADGVITIPEVTGNIVIIANGAESDNLIVLSECTSGDTMPDGAAVTSGTLLVTPLLAVTPSTVYKTNIHRVLPDGTTFYTQKIYYYDDSQTYLSCAQMQTQANANDIVNWTVNSSAYYVRILFRVENTNPYFGESGVIVSGGESGGGSSGSNEPETPSGAESDNITLLYNLTEPMSFTDGTTTFDTGVKLFAESDMDWSIMYDITYDGNIGSNRYRDMIYCGTGTSGSDMPLLISKDNNTGKFTTFMYAYGNNTTDDTVDGRKGVIVHTKGTQKKVEYDITNTSGLSLTSNKIFAQVDAPIYLGGIPSELGLELYNHENAKCTINAFKVFSKALSQEEALALLEV